jgi:aminoglycoside phosphotransferase
VVVGDQGSRDRGADPGSGHVWLQVLSPTADLGCRGSSRLTDLLREAHVAAALPTTVGYPEIVDVGVLGGHEYLLTGRIPGISVSRAWPTLSGDERAEALKQLWALAENVHRVALSDL